MASSQITPYYLLMSMETQPHRYISRQEGRQYSSWRNLITIKVIEYVRHRRTNLFLYRTSNRSRDASTYLKHTIVYPSFWWVGGMHSHKPTWSKCDCACPINKCEWTSRPSNVRLRRLSSAWKERFIMHPWRNLTNREAVWEGGWLWNFSEEITFSSKI